MLAFRLRRRMPIPSHGMRSSATMGDCPHRRLISASRRGWTELTIGYSSAGLPVRRTPLPDRSRVIPVDRRDGTQNYEKDKRHFLYKAYLRIIAEHSPPDICDGERQGDLSAEVGGKPIINRILSDLRHPIPAARGEDESRNGGLEYRVYPVADYSGTRSLFEANSESHPTSYIVKSEAHRIPQARHRLILLGVRSDIEHDRKISAFSHDG